MSFSVIPWQEWRSGYSQWIRYSTYTEVAPRTASTLSTYTTAVSGFLRTLHAGGEPALYEALQEAERKYKVEHHTTSYARISAWREFLAYINVVGYPKSYLTAGGSRIPVFDFTRTPGGRVIEPHPLAKMIAYVGRFMPPHVLAEYTIGAFLQEVRNNSHDALRMVPAVAYMMAWAWRTQTRRYPPGFDFGPHRILPVRPPVLADVMSVTIPPTDEEVGAVAPDFDFHKLFVHRSDIGPRVARATLQPHDLPALLPPMAALEAVAVRKGRGRPAHVMVPYPSPPPLIENPFAPPPPAAPAPSAWRIEGVDLRGVRAEGEEPITQREGPAAALPADSTDPFGAPEVPPG